MPTGAQNTLPANGSSSSSRFSLDVVMYSVEDGTIFTKEHLTKIFKMTEGMDTVYGVNHNQIESIGHRTVRHLRVAPGGRIGDARMPAAQGLAGLSLVRQFLRVGKG